MMADEFDVHIHMNARVPRYLSLTRLKHHKVALYNVDRFIYDIFDPIGARWSANMSGFLCPDGTISLGAYYWRMLSDRCYDISSSIRGGLNSKVESKFEQFLQELGATSWYQHPAFIVQWRICLRIQGFETHIPSAKAMDRFLLLVKEAQPDNHPLQLLATALGSADRTDLRHILRMGCLKAIRTLTEVIGDENAMVLEMVTFYCKFFGTSFLAWRVLLGKFEYVWHHTHNLHETYSTASVAISYAFTYAAYYVLDALYVAFGMAEKLRDSLSNHPYLVNQGPVVT
jgi:hypothetical protein